MSALTFVTAPAKPAAKVQTVAKAQGGKAARAAFPKAFVGRQVAFQASAHVKAQRSALKVQASDSFVSTGNPDLDEMILNSWPNEDFIARTLQEFPEAGVANVEQSIALIKRGDYTLVDVRSSLEYDESKCPLSINVPLLNITNKYDSEKREKVVKKEENVEFLEQFKKKIPNKDTPLIIMCSGRKIEIDGAEILRMMEVLYMLDDEGYTNTVAMKGGYNTWTRTFDNKLNRRRGDGFVEEYSHGAASCGIHGTGAGFQKMDAADPWIPTQY